MEMRKEEQKPVHATGVLRAVFQVLAGSAPGWPERGAAGVPTAGARLCG